MEKKVFIARELDDRCFVYENKPVADTDGYDIDRDDDKFGIICQATAEILGIPFPARGKMIELSMPAQTAAPEPEPPAETLVPITDLSQLKVGDKVRAATGERTVLALVGGIVVLSRGNEPDIPGALCTLKLIKKGSYQQVVTAKRTLNRKEAWQALAEGKTVRCVGSAVWYRLHSDKNYIAAGTGRLPIGFANVGLFDIQEGRYEIVQ